MINNTEIAEVLETSAKELEDGLWIQEESGHKEIGRCAVRVIIDVILQKTQNLALDALPYDYINAMAVVRTQLHSFLHLHPASSVMAWNDVPGRTKEEVIDAFIGCAKELRNKG